jgi:hypothetical protein
VAGEWIASDWPICPIAETANPQRMGAALTYANSPSHHRAVHRAGDEQAWWKAAGVPGLRPQTI